MLDAKVNEMAKEIQDVTPDATPGVMVNEMAIELAETWEKIALTACRHYREQNETVIVVLMEEVSPANDSHSLEWDWCERAVFARLQSQS